MYKNSAPGRKFLLSFVPVYEPSKSRHFAWQEVPDTDMKTGRA